MRQYDGLFILKRIGHEEDLGKVIDGISSCIADAGGKVTSIERMGSKTFERAANNRFKNGFYFSALFEISADGLKEAQAAWRENRDIFRSFICRAAKRPPLEAQPKTSTK